MSKEMIINYPLFYCLIYQGLDMFALSATAIPFIALMSHCENQTLVVLQQPPVAFAACVFALGLNRICSHAINPIVTRLIPRDYRKRLKGEHPNHTALVDDFMSTVAPE